MLEKLLRVFHIFIAVGDLIRHWLYSIPLRFPMFPYQWKNSQLKSDARDLKKVPTHLGLIICEEEFSFPDIANIIVWSIAFGVSYFSIYDLHGYLKRKSKELKEEIDNAQKKCLDEEHRRYTVIMHSGDEAHSHTNGYCRSNQIDIQLLSKVDGRQALVDTTRLLCQQVASRERRLEDITPSTVDEFIKENSHFPDPELVIRFGIGESLFGYQPWQIRLTEFLSARSHHSIGYKSFTDLLHTYGETKQRFGR